jgi:hypothetical protein
VSEGADGSVGPPALVRQVQLSLLRVATGTVLVFVAAYLVLIVTRLLAPAEWEFALEVDSQVASLDLEPGTLTHWRIDGATLCARDALALPAASALSDPRAACGSRTWRGWRLHQPEQALTLRGGTTVLLESDGGRLAVSLRAAADGDSLGTLEVVGSVPELELGRSVNLFWEAQSAPPLSFPFTAATTLGRAVSWSDARMLRGGTVTVFTTDDSADRRSQVDQAALMLGDQVSLEGNDAAVWPKGFVRPAADLSGLRIVAFGRADSLEIERYGDSGYDFRPDTLARLINDPAVTVWGSLLLAYMTLVLGVVPFLEGRSVLADEVPYRYRYLRWFLKHRE